MQIIYLIDDDHASHVYHKVMSKAAGYSEEQIQTFNSADEAIDKLTEIIQSKKLEQWPSHILLDINMPVKTGFNFLDEASPFLSENHSPPEIYMVSSSNNPKDVDKANSYNLVQGFVSKFASVDFFLKIKQSSN